jgi:hypothetical protein
MAWVSFLLGRPGLEYTLSANPDSFDPGPARVSYDNYTLSGALRERVVRTMRPTVKMKSNWFPKADYDNLTSLLAVTDTFLSFITRNDWNVNFEPNIAPNTTTVQINESSASLLSAIYAAGGYGSTPTLGTITINGVWNTLALVGGVLTGSGTNYYTGGSYADSTRTITLGTALPQAQQVYVSYTYPGWLCRLKQIAAPIEGGRIDLFTYDLQLDGA